MKPIERKYAVLLAKATIAVLILGLLAWQAQQQDAFAQLVQGRKRWSMLAAGLGATIAALVLSFVRWSVIARAAGIALTFGESIRWGALGFALTFVGPGAVGGDVLKAVAVARERKGQRTAATTTVLVDRFMGLFAMLLTASTAILVFSAFDAAPTGVAWLVCQSTLAVTGGAVCGVGLLFVPGLANDRFAERLTSVPVVGSVLPQVIQAWKDYQQRPGLLAAALAMSLVVDFFLVLSFYCVALGLPFDAPSLVDHFFIVPINLISSALPITPGGVGVREGVADLMYQGFGVPAGQGTLIAAGHSLTMLAAGGVAVLYYFAERGRSGENLTGESPLESEPVS